MATVGTQIEGLVQEKNEVDRSPLTKEELLSVCKKTLREGLTEHFLNELLVSHLKDVQIRRLEFLHPSLLSTYFATDRNLQKWFFAILTEELLAKAIQSLPDIGIPAKDRERKVADLEKKISDLEAQIEKLLS